MLKSLLALLFCLPAFAQSLETLWPTRVSRVVCGGRTQNQDLKIRSVNDQLLATEADDGSMLAYIDLSKPGRVKWVIVEMMSDADAEARDQLALQLTPENRILLRRLSAKHTSVIYSGMTSGLAHLDFEFAGRTLSLSCQELPR